MMEPIVEVGLPGGPRREVPVCAPVARVTAAVLARRSALYCCGSLRGGMHWRQALAREEERSAA